MKQKIVESKKPEIKPMPQLSSGKKNDGEILRFDYSNVCLFCGRRKEIKYEDHQVYFECDCPDAKKTREIYDQIDKLKENLPKEKFKIVEELVLYRK